MNPEMPADGKKLVPRGGVFFSEFSFFPLFHRFISVAAYIHSGRLYGHRGTANSAGRSLGLLGLKCGSRSGVN